MQELNAQSNQERVPVRMYPTTAMSGPLAPEILPVIGVLLDFDRGSLKFNQDDGSKIGGPSLGLLVHDMERGSLPLFQDIEQDQGSSESPLQISALDELSLYPVPVVNELNLSININADLRIQLYDVLGRLVAEESPNNVRKHSIDMSRFNNGIYILRVQAGTEVATRKFELYR